MQRWIWLSLVVFVPALLVGGLLSASDVGVSSPACAQEEGSVVRTERGGPSRLRVIRRIRTGIQPKSVELSPDGERIYVCNFGRPDRDNVKVYAASDLSEVGTIEFEGNAVETAFSEDGQWVYISNFRRAVVEVVNAETLQVEREIEVGNNPKVMAISPNGRRMYVANWSSDTVTELNAETYAHQRDLRTGRHPRGMAVLNRGRLFVAAMYSHMVQVFDRGASRERTHFRPCRYPRHLVLSPDESRLYVSCSCCRQVRWFDPLTYELQGIAQTGQNPRTVALSRDGRYLVVAGFDDSTVTLIDTVENTHRVHVVPDANQIVGVAIGAGEQGPRLYATSWLTGELIVMEPVVRP